MASSIFRFSGLYYPANHDACLRFASAVARSCAKLSFPGADSSRGRICFLLLTHLLPPAGLPAHPAFLISSETCVSEDPHPRAASLALILSRSAGEAKCLCSM